MNAFLKDNYVLVIGLLMPIVLAFIFFISMTISITSTEPPKYQVVYATGYNNINTNPINFEIDADGQLVLDFEPNEKKGRPPEPQLFLFDPVTERIQQISLPKYDLEKSGVYPIEGLGGAKVSKDLQSPDGYMFEHNFRSDANLMTAMFGGGTRYRNRNVLVSGNRRILVPNSGARGNGQFVAWIIEPAQKPAP